MPLKISKGFTRRRSSGNLLEDVETPTSTFRVLPRPDDAEEAQHFDAGASLKRRSAVKPRTSPRQASQPSFRRNSSYDDTSESSNRGSGNTYSSTGQPSAENNNRDSYASTEPSSVESHPREDAPSSPSKHLPPPPPEPSQRERSFSIKAAARTFSFGSRKQSFRGADSHQGRDRSATESSYASTATPPKLELGSELGVGTTNFGSDFSDLLGQRKSTIFEDPAEAMASANGAPVHRDSMDESNEERRLMGSPPLLSDQPSFALDALNASRYLDRDYSQPFSYEPPSQFSNTTTYPLRSRGDGPPASRSVGRPSQPNAVTGSIYRKSMFDGSAFENASETRSFASGDDEPLFDNIRNPRSQIFRPRPTVVPQKQKNKVMTPEQFEQYRSQVTEPGVDDDSRSEKSSGSNDYDDEDETERNRQMAKQRRRQEAQLAVYRQQMVKVTGEQPSELPTNLGRPGLPRASASAPSLTKNPAFSASNPDLQLEDDEEDDDVPLGVLQAHGFPSKSRTPTRMSAASLNMFGDQRPYPPPAGSTRNDAAAGGNGGSSLPPFARNLPADPYIGASLVNQPTRDSLRPGSAAIGGSTANGGIPPGGLVGVIAGEERARAMRRGSPNTQGIYDVSSVQQQQYQSQQQHQMGFGTHIPMMPLQPPMTAGDQAQMEFNQSMTQMMQMQMQWMQQMMTMYSNGQNGGPMPPMPNFPMMPPGMQIPQMPQQQQQQRPQSQHRPHTSMSSYARSSTVLPNPRSASMLDLSTGGPGPGYTPSIAPSERSNVGQPSRYRPVTAAGDPYDHDRASMYMGQPGHTRSHSQLTVTGLPSRPASSMSFSRSPAAADGNKRTTIRAIDKPKRGVAVTSDDEEDEEGWKDMLKKKEARKSKWRMTRQAPAGAAQGQDQGGMEGLFYDA